MTRRCACLLFLLLVMTALSRPTWAQGAPDLSQPTGDGEPAADAPPVAPAAEPYVDAPPGPIAVDLASPRATMFTFLEAMGRIERGLGDEEDAWDAALATLNAPDDFTAAQRRDAAALLKSVIDKLGTVTEEDLPDARDIGRQRRYVFFPREHGWVWEALREFDPPRMITGQQIVLRQGDDERWRFTPETVAQIDELAEAMAPLPPRHVLPVDASDVASEVVGLLGTTFTHTRWWQWGALLGAIFVGLLAGKLVQGVLRSVSERLRKHGWLARATVFDDLASPASLALFTLGLQVGLNLIRTDPAVGEFIQRVMMLLYIVAGGWFLYNLVDLVDVAMRHITGKTDSRLDNMVVPLIRKSLRIFLVVVFAIFTLQNVFELDITGFLAGLGIAGLALSLAAQDSVKNLFGSLTVFFDKPFAVGDFITFDGNTGTVEEIGFRSTRIRLVSGHLVTVPNMKFIDNNVENVSLRPSIRREMDVTITYDTPPEKIEEAVEILREVLTDPEVVEEGRFDMDNAAPRVSFSELNADSLNIKGYYWYQMAGDPDRGWFTYLEHAQIVNLKLFRRYAEAGIEFAFPTQTLYLAGDPSRQLAVHLLQGQEQEQGAAGG